MPKKKLPQRRSLHNWAYVELEQITRHVKDATRRFMRVAQNLTDIDCPEAEMVKMEFDAALARLGGTKSSRFSDDDRTVIDVAKRALAEQIAEQTRTDAPSRT